MPCRLQVKAITFLLKTKIVLRLHISYSAARTEVMQLFNIE